MRGRWRDPARARRCSVPSVAVLLAVLLSACGGYAVHPPPTHQAAAPTGPRTNPSSPVGQSPRRASEPLPAKFVGRVAPFTKRFAAQLRRTTWHPGCPVPPRDIRLLTLRYWGFDGRVHEGRMEVNASVAADVVSVFRSLFRARFPINELHL